MDRFAPLLDSLVFTPSRLGKLRLMHEYFATTPDPDRGWALAALTGELSFPGVKPAQIRNLVLERVDAELFALSHDFVGDLAETVALIWPSKHGANRVPTLSEVVDGMMTATRDRSGALLTGWLNALDATERWALLKLATGALRVGVSARLAKTALAEGATVSLDEIEAVWHALKPPYTELFAWLEGHAARPEIGNRPTFTPLMLAQPLDEDDIAKLDPSDYRAEWKWDGIRVQLVGRGAERRLYSRSGDDIGAAFPDLLAVLSEDVVLDGELLVMRDGAVAPFNDLQQRLNRKTATPKMIADYPAWVRLYDILEQGGEDLRGLTFDQRRRRLEDWYRAAPRPRMDISPLLPFAGWDQLREFRDGAREQAIEGLMLKRAEFHLCLGPAEGPMVQMEARRAHRRYGADVCAARPR